MEWSILKYTIIIFIYVKQRNGPLKSLQVKVQDALLIHIVFSTIKIFFIHFARNMKLLHLISFSEKQKQLCGRPRLLVMGRSWNTHTNATSTRRTCKLHTWMRYEPESLLGTCCHQDIPFS